jgi:hypothetical protein
MKGFGMKLTYLSQGKLFVKDDEQEARQIESHFGQEVVARALRTQQRNEWKARKEGTPFGGSMLWGVQQENPRATQVAITGITRGEDADTVFYLLDTETTGGLFRYNWQENSERRLFHKENFRVRDLDWHLEQHLIVGSQSFQNGAAHIITMNAEGRDLRQHTEGDAVDEAPTWVPGPARRILFQSSGIARNQQGLYRGLGPYIIQELDLERHTLNTLLEDSSYDFLCPRMDTRQNLYFIRRPYESLHQPKYGLTQGLLDFLLFPLRLLRAIFHFLNFFSLAFSQKPLTTASGPKITSDDEKTLYLRGRIIDVQKSLREAEKNHEAPSLVPKSWELVRRGPTGAEDVVAKGVLAFDLTTAGTVVYTNGSAIYQVDSQNKARQIAKGALIEQLLVVKE